MLVKHSGCPCGCPSLVFAPPPDETRIPFRHSNSVAEMYGYTTNGITDAANIYVSLSLGQAGGKFTGLEVYDLAGRPEGKPYPLPTLETIHTAEETSTKGRGTSGWRR
ncbi:MAG: hypothetical protein V4734_00415 [Terriglobus sp.]